MVFDRSAFMRFEDDDRYTILQKAIRVDSSNSAYEMVVVPPQTSSSAQTFTATCADGAIVASPGYGAYNNGNVQYIDVYYGSNFKPNVSGLYLVIEYKPYQFRRLTNAGTAFVGCPIDPNTTPERVNEYSPMGYSIPYHPAYWFDNVYLFSGSSDQTVEQYVFGENRFGDLCNARALMEYRRDAIEHASGFFTPCIESKFDDLTLSPESVNRTQKWLIGSINTTGGQLGYNTWVSGPEVNLPITGRNVALPVPCSRGGTPADALQPGLNEPVLFEKAIPLSDLLSSATNQGFWTNAPKLRFQFTMKTGDKIAFCAANCGGNFNTGSQAAMQATYNAIGVGNCSPVYIAVSRIRMLSDSARMTPTQSIETASEKKEMIVNNIPFFDWFSQPSQSQSQIVVTGQRDVQAIVVGFDAWNSPTNVVGSWRGNAVGNYSQKDQGNLTYLSLLYGVDQTLKQPLNVTPSAVSNGLAYALYRKACNLDRANLVAPALPFDRYFVYNYYFFPVFPQSSVHLVSDPRDVRIDISAVAQRSIVTLLKRFNGAQLSSNSSVDKLN